MEQIMNELATLLTRVAAAANDPPPDGAAFCSEPRVYPPGHPAAEGLRAVWGVPPGGRRVIRNGQPKSNDVNANLLRQTNVVNARRTKEREEKARDAWSLVENGASIADASAAVGLQPKTLKVYWKRMGLEAA
jgi:hypothetical protein